MSKQLNQLRHEIEFRDHRQSLQRAYRRKRQYALGEINPKRDMLLKKGKPVIICCRSGARSGLAESMLRTAGVNAYNGGAWESLMQKI